MSTHTDERDTKLPPSDTVDDEKPWTQKREDVSGGEPAAEFDPHRYYDAQAGRLVVSPECVPLSDGSPRRARR